MRHAVFVGPGKVVWREAPDPVIQGAGEAIVRPLVVGRCDLDVAYVRGLLPMPPGAPIGHEIIGEITAVGEGVSEARIGQRVFVPAQISCGTCKPCRWGMTGRCASVPFAASYGMGREGGFGGGLADLVRVPFAEAMLTPLPAGVDPKALIGAADMATDAWRAVGPHVRARPGARVLVLGGMPPVIGLYCVGIATALSAEAAYVDGDAARRDVAVGFGACEADAELAAIEGVFDIVVVANPRVAALEAAFARVAPGGIITSVTPAIDGAATLATAELYHRGVSWTIGRPDCRHGHDGAISAWGLEGFRPDLVPTRYVGWDEAPDAWSSDALYVAAVRS